MPHSDSGSEGVEGSHGPAGTDDLRFAFSGKAASGTDSRFCGVVESGVDEDAALLSEVRLGPATPFSRGRQAEPIRWEVIRSLTRDDLPLLSGPPAMRQAAPTITNIKARHHLLAQLLAQGDTPDAEAALICNYSIAYISRLRTEDPAFQELLASYRATREIRYVDVIERMRTLGLEATDELQARLDAAPESFSNRELMELQEQNIIKPAASAARAASTALVPQGASGISVNVNFVTAQPRPLEPPLPSEATSPPVIEHEPAGDPVSRAKRVGPPPSTALQERGK